MHKLGKVNEQVLTWKEVQGVPKKTLLQNAAGATVHWLNHNLLELFMSGDCFLVISY